MSSEGVNESETGVNMHRETAPNNAELAKSSFFRTHGHMHI